MIYFDHDFYQRCGAATFFGRLQMSEVPEPTSALGKNKAAPALYTKICHFELLNRLIF